MDHDEFRRHGHEIVDWLADYFRDIASHPIVPAATPGELRRALPTAAPVEGAAVEAVAAVPEASPIAPSAPSAPPSAEPAVKAPSKPVAVAEAPAKAALKKGSYTWRVLATDDAGNKAVDMLSAQLNTTVMGITLSIKTENSFVLGAVHHKLQHGNCNVVDFINLF